MKLLAIFALLFTAQISLANDPQIDYLNDLSFLKDISTTQNPIPNEGPLQKLKIQVDGETEVKPVAYVLEQHASENEQLRRFINYKCFQYKNSCPDATLCSTAAYISWKISSPSENLDFSSKSAICGIADVLSTSSSLECPQVAEAKLRCSLFKENNIYEKQFSSPPFTLSGKKDSVDIDRNNLETFINSIKTVSSSRTAYHEACKRSYANDPSCDFVGRQFVADNYTLERVLSKHDIVFSKYQDNDIVTFMMMALLSFLIMAGIAAKTKIGIVLYIAILATSFYSLYQLVSCFNLPEADGARKKFAISVATALALSYYLFWDTFWWYSFLAPISLFIFIGIILVLGGYKFLRYIISLLIRK
ncbi:hypothetical protein [Bdellovibrio bacteriovorus]|uniref:hypothetical protein n=1 Tax=Bdellovibrio bacteriovorus TaxID=959 RepID=UPI0035A6F9A6